MTIHRAVQIFGLLQYMTQRLPRLRARQPHLRLFIGAILIVSTTTACTPQMLTIQAEETGVPPVAPNVSLHAAALQGKVNVVRQHIQAGSNLDEVDAYGSTPLIIAITFGETEVARELIEAGADLSISNSEGSNPLHLAAFLGRTEIVKTLLENDADKYVRNNDGSTAFDIVAAPFDDDKWLYDSILQGLSPLGLALDYEQIEMSRAQIAEMLRPGTEELEAVDYTPLPSDDWAVSTPDAQGVDPLLVAELYLDAAEMETLYGLLVFKNGYLVGERYFNAGSVGQKERLQSVTKSYTSALVGLALQQGCLTSVDQKMMDFFPEFADQLTDPRKEQITIRHLLQMRAGYPWEESTPELFELLYEGFRPATLVDVPLVNEPGTEFAYSNLSSHLLGIIVARACDTDLKTFAQEHLFTPLNVAVGNWIQDWEGYYNGHGDLYLTARDAAKLGQVYLEEGMFQGVQIIPADWVNDSLQIYSEDVNSAGIQSGRVGRYFRSIGYGYQWWAATVDHQDFNLAWGHGGQLIIVLNKLDMVIVVLSDPLWGQHDQEAWRHERANINLVGKFVESLPDD